MKHIIFFFSCFFILGSSLYAQVGDKMNFKMIVRNAGNELLLNSPIGLKFKIIQDTEAGTVVFEETHSTTTDSFGMVAVRIGAGTAVINTIANIDWSTGLYFISTEVDPLGGSTYTLQETTALNSMPFSASAAKAISAETLDYNTLTNKPETISATQNATVNFLNVTNAINLDDTKIAVDLNTLKAFPGFGTTTGTAFEIFWHKVGDDAYFTSGTIGIGTNTNLDTTAASLVVESGIQFQPNPGLTAELGVLDYFNLSPTFNDFFYGDNVGTTVIYNGNVDAVLNNDTNILENLGIGDGMVSSYNFYGNNLVLASTTPTILFEDTSSSASFPTSDWRIRINDLADGGEDYFSFDNADTDVSNFKIMANAPSNAFTIQSEGSIGFQTETPSEKLELTNTVSATSFIGDSSNLTNLPAGTASTTNTGSTTIGSDTNSDTIGVIHFETQNLSRMSIQANGDIAIGSASPTVTLDVEGDAKMENLTTGALSFAGSLITSISVETPPSTYTNIDILDKRVIVFNATSSNSYFSFANGTNGQVVTIINSGTGTLTFLNGNILNSGAITLGQNDSFTFVQQSTNQFLVLDVVN
jgi:hypothetical protein